MIRFTTTPDAGTIELRLLVGRLRILAEDAGIAVVELDRVVSFYAEDSSMARETRARRFVTVLEVAGSLLGDGDTLARWFRRSNAGLCGLTPMEALVENEDALVKIRNALVNEHRAAFPLGGI